MRDHRDLLVWRRANALSMYVFRATIALGELEGTRHYQLQIRRSVSSLPFNIAEGYHQATAAQFARYLSIAIGSSGEALAQIGEIRELELVSAAVAAHIVEELNHVRAMSIRLRKHLRLRIRK